MTSRFRTPVLFFVLVAFALTGALAQKPDPAAMAKIREEGLQRSQLMQTLTYLTEVIGPRLAGSPQMRRANQWTRDKLTEWGLQNAAVEPWGTFGAGWSLKRYSLQVTSPTAFPVISYPKAWSPGVRGKAEAPLVYMKASTEADLAAYEGKLKGAVVLVGETRVPRAVFSPLASRYTEEQLLAMGGGRPGAGGDRPVTGASSGAATGRRPTQASEGTGFSGQISQDMMQRFAFGPRRLQFLMEQGAVAVLEPSSRGDGGTLFVQQAAVPAAPPSRQQSTPAAQAASAETPPGVPPAIAQMMRRQSPWAKDAPRNIPQIVLSTEHFNRLARILEAGEPVRVALELQVERHTRDLNGYNTIAEIPGTDLKDEIVMLGGHLDSWHSATGVTDNGAGVAVCMEAVRILQAAGLRPRRTIRIALWDAEEQGLMGSRGYVAKHFASRARPGAELTKLPAYDKISAYFNLDNGTGKIRGIYAQGNSALLPIFAEWLEPFHDLGATTVTVRSTGGTDHQAFDSVGIPGFQFIQDPIEYSTRTHHSNMDVLDRAQEDDLKQAAVIMAAFVYNAAMRDEKLPRKPIR